MEQKTRHYPAVLAAGVVTFCIGGLLGMANPLFFWFMPLGVTIVGAGFFMWLFSVIEGRLLELRQSLTDRAE